MFTTMILAVFWAAFCGLNGGTAALADGAIGDPTQEVAQFSSFLKRVPGGDRLGCLAKDFLAIVRPGAYSAFAENAQLGNAGLDQFINDKLKDPVFASQVKSFYTDVDSYLRESGSKPWANAGSSSAPNLELPSLFQTAGDSDHAKLQPGWLWKLALKDAQGDPNRAIGFIGVCGTDDTLQSINQACPSGNAQDGPASADADFYLPQSLGKNIDISPSLKKRILRRKAAAACDSTDPAQCLPAKYYHIYGSAFVACELIQRGHNPALVTEVSELAGWYYRVLWLSNLAQQDPAATPEKTAHGWLDSLREIVDFGKPLACSATVPEPEPEPPLGADSENEQVQRDALQLMRQWTLSRDFGSQLGQLYTDIPTSPVAKIDALTGVELGRPAGWSKDRFKKAFAKFRSIMTDFAWTAEQHRIGAEFAAKVCKPDPKQEKNACGKDSPAAQSPASPDMSTDIPADGAS